MASAWAETSMPSRASGAATREAATPCRSGSSATPPPMSPRLNVGRCRLVAAEDEADARQRGAVRHRAQLAACAADQTAVAVSRRRPAADELVGIVEQEEQASDQSLFHEAEQILDQGLACSAVDQFGTGSKPRRRWAAFEETGQSKSGSVWTPTMGISRTCSVSREGSSRPSQVCSRCLSRVVLL